jgi:hypothetical protein
MDWAKLVVDSMDFKFDVLLQVLDIELALGLQLSQ